MKIRTRLEKVGLARFLSHLDLQRTLERTLRRAGLPVAYSQGFNPHPKLNFASALATGTSSTGEFVDIELSQPMDLDHFVTQANQFFPAGLRLAEARLAPAGGGALMERVDTAEYLLTLGGSAPALAGVEEAIAAFLHADEVLVEKESKRGTHLVNIRPQVYELSQEKAGDGQVQLRLVAQVGMHGNLKPEDLLRGLNMVVVGREPVTLIAVHRNALYCREPESGNLTLPWDV